ncbi:MAG TPA: YsnF/AvaK domain-containing protein [Gammaproteobacteria bacterium]|jgi:uncharacterized protein (TIGR02271 family)|nr:YsnF/AvaK domain-containing protein [Gammaproteobacteria bacterium]HKH20193.1 YsnF/AvaK domain-containing protein [Gammaproteobacteria bacterium]
MARSSKDQGLDKQNQQPRVSADELESQGEGGSDAGLQGVHQQTVIPIIREELAVGKRAIETGKGVRVTKTVLEREQIVDEPLAREEAFIERVNINEMIAGQDMPTIRYEGETMVVPILEEVLVTEKRTILKEEVRITRKRREVREPQQFVLRTDQVSAEHFDASVAPSAKTGEQD